MNSELLSRALPVSSTLLLLAPPAQAVVVSPADPPEWTDRRRVFFDKCFGPQAILETAPGMIVDTARGFPRQWSRGGLGCRQEAEVAARAVRLHREDPRYFRMPDGRFGRRLAHAVRSTVIVRGADGPDTIGLARLADVYGAWAIATLWNPPDQRNIPQFAKYGTLGLGFKAGSNVFREFSPDVKKVLRRP
jgi:hypothetical protein